MKLSSHFLSLSLALFLLLSSFLTGCQGKKKESVEKEDAAVPLPAMQQVNITDQFLDAALNGDLEKIKAMMKDGMEAGVRGEGERTALMLAAYNGHTEIVRYLLKKGAKVNTRDAMGQTALIYASSGPFPETVKVLLDHKADPDIIAKGDGWTALMFAAAEGQTEVVKILLQHGADATIKEKDGDTAESFARQNGHTGLADYLHRYLQEKR